MISVRQCLVSTTGFSGAVQSPQCTNSNKPPQLGVQYMQTNVAGRGEAAVKRIDGSGQPVAVITVSGSALVWRHTIVLCNPGKLNDSKIKLLSTLPRSIADRPVSDG